MSNIAEEFVAKRDISKNGVKDLQFCLYSFDCIKSIEYELYISKSRNASVFHWFIPNGFSVIWTPEVNSCETFIGDETASPEIPSCTDFINDTRNSKNVWNGIYSMLNDKPLFPATIPRSNWSDVMAYINLITRLFCVLPRNYSWSTLFKSIFHPNGPIDQFNRGQKCLLNGISRFYHF